MYVLFKKAITRSSANFAAKTLDVKIGEEVGYFYAGENMTKDKTKLIFATPGSIISKLTHSDPYLKEYNAIIIDEAHERSLQTDLILLLLKRALTVNKDLKLIIMSATINLDLFRNYFPTKDFKFGEVDAGETTLFNIEDYYEEKPVNDWKESAIEKVSSLLKTTDSGDILIFITASGDGNSIISSLQQRFKNSNTINPFYIILHGGAPKADQDYATDPQIYKSHPDCLEKECTRKVVLSTNVAESSLTVEGIVYVVDCGLELEESYNPLYNVRSLTKEWIAKSAVKQRRGRAGRVSDGFCYHLYTKDEYEKFKDFPIPDIQKKDLSTTILDIMNLEYINNIGELKSFLKELIEPPSLTFINSSLHTLKSLDCIDNNKNSGVLNLMGKTISKFRSIEPTMAKALLTSYYYNCLDEMAIIVSMIKLIDSRMDKLFMEFRPNKKMLKNMTNKNIETMKSNINKHRLKDCYSSSGDFFTFLKTYQKYLESKDKNEFITKYNLSKKTLERMPLKIAKFKEIVFKIVQPAEVRKAYYESLKNNNVNKNKIKEINEEIKNDSGGILEDIHDDTPLNSQSGGGKRRNFSKFRIKRQPFELKLFENAVLFDNIDNNIFKSLLNGYFVNSAKLIKKDLYKTCFPIEKSDARI